MHSDDISNVLILNKKAIASHESQLFKSELEKFRQHQNRILQANHKQASLLKELSRAYSDLLKDKRVRSEQSKYEAFSRQRSSVQSKYRRVYQGFNDLEAGLLRAQRFYTEMKENVSSLEKNVETFVNNRRSEGGQLLGNIEEARKQKFDAHMDQEQHRLKELTERMSVEPADAAGSTASKRQQHRPTPRSSHAMAKAGLPQTAHQPYNPAASPPVTPRYGATQSQPQYTSPAQHQQPYQSGLNGYQTAAPTQPARREGHVPRPSHEPYNPNAYAPISPPAQQQYFSSPPTQNAPFISSYGYSSSGTPQPNQGQSHLPPGYVPPPPPGPPPGQSDYPGYGVPAAGGRSSASGHHGQQQQQRNLPGNERPPAADPWAGLSQWR